MTKGTIRLCRVLRAGPERVWRAFPDAVATAKRLAPCGFICKVHRMDASVGGTCPVRRRAGAARRDGEGTSCQR